MSACLLCGELAFARDHVCERCRASAESKRTALNEHAYAEELADVLHLLEHRARSRFLDGDSASYGTLTDLIDELRRAEHRGAPQAKRVQWNDTTERYEDEP